MVHPLFLHAASHHFFLLKHCQKVDQQNRVFNIVSDIRQGVGLGYQYRVHTKAGLFGFIYHLKSLVLLHQCVFHFKCFNTNWEALLQSWLVVFPFL